MEQSKRRQQIVEVAIHTIAELGYAQASVGQIVKRACVSKGVFTYHFASKDELMEQIVHEVFETAARFMSPQMEGQTAPNDMLKAYIESNLEFMGAHRDYIVALTEIVTNARTPDGKLRFGGTSDDSILEPLIEILQWGQETGEFKTLTERSAQVTAAAIRSAIDGVANQLLVNPGLDLAEYAAELAALFLSAVRRPSHPSDFSVEGGEKS
ncbi:TetR/AcrR family transcriptional regulator [Paenibacillus sp. XY044]|uniref:TetR/AcrR family transcriptional regulator n=1 Tax=Paenibacillus sp. XY044 TaxID=2026089 RepID=UPI000B9874EA|nr:TetR/AcrR family transcriptional regulator [Paenibacillus sp. XY044]OZB94048.1 hypothetical protein CJP46_17655 [Paenibacillus sp. XY044]